jgi:hypothetical protein
MVKRIPLSTLIGQEKRTFNLFITLLLTIVFIIDWLLKSIFMGGIGTELLLPYIFLSVLRMNLFFSKGLLIILAAIWRKYSSFCSPQYSLIRNITILWR